MPSIPKGAHWCEPPAARLAARGIGTPYTHEAYPHVFVVRNNGPTTCVIGGRATIRIAKGAPTPLEISAVGATTPGYPSDGRPWGLRPGRTATEQIVTWAICNERPGDAVRHAVVHVIYRSSTVVVPFLTCARSGASIEVGPFEPPPLPDHEPAWPLHATVRHLPPTVRAGSTAVYRVRLTNTSRRRFRFPYCPPVDVRIGRSDHVLTLNCEPVAFVAPGASVDFEQHTTLAHGFPPGRYHLRWSLEQIGAEKERITAFATVRVEGP